MNFVESIFTNYPFVFVRFSVPTDIAAASMTIYDLSGRAIRSVSLVGLTS